MKLSKEQIRHVDKTLKLNGVLFQDIKAELTDHIATDIEEYVESSDVDFDEAFKIVFEKWKPELRPISRSIFLVDHFKGPKIVVDKLLSYSKTEFKNLLMLTIIFGSLTAALLFLNFSESIFGVVDFVFKACFVGYILLTILGLLFIYISKALTTYCRLFTAKIGLIAGFPLLAASNIFTFSDVVRSGSVWANLVINFLLMYLLLSCLFSIRSLFQHFKAVKKYKLI